MALETLEVPADLKMKTAFELRRYNFDVQKLEHFLGDLREEKTADEIAAIFSAAGDSVTVINADANFAAYQTANPTSSDTETEWKAMI